MKHLFAQLKQFANHPSDLGRVIRNVSWVSGERALRLIIGLAVTSLLARYLGPESFGVLSLGMAIIAVLLPLAELGLQGVIIKAHVETPEQSDLISGTSLVLRFIGGLLTIGIAIGTAQVLSTDDTRLVSIVAILSLTALFRNSDTFRHIFESKVYTKPIIVADFFSSILANSLKIFAVTCGASLLVFALIHTLEVAIAAIVILAIYRNRIGNLSKLRFSRSKAIMLLGKGWPLVLSSLAVIIYMKIDQIMLGAMLGETEVGIYAIAARISEVWYFVPGAIAWSTFPFLIEAKKENPEFYIRRLIRLFRSLLLLATSLAIVIGLSSDLLIELLFGAQFERASKVLLIHAWGGTFAVLSMVTRYWAINENLQHLEIVRTLSGALINILLNLYFIPTHGVMGAAYATLLSQLWAGFLFDLVPPSTRALFAYKVQAACFWCKA